MKILAFDTSTRGISLAVADNQTILRHRTPKTQFLSSSIMPEIQSILKSCRLTLKSLDGIIIGLGPGSFTSLRVGIATAQALAFANKIPAVGISSLDVIAMNVKGDGAVCVMNDARRGLVYSCCYGKGGSWLKRLTDYSLDKPEDFINAISERFNPLMPGASKSRRESILKQHGSPIETFGDDKNNTTVIGDAVPLYRTLLQQRGLTLIEDPKMFSPDARHLVTLGFEQLKQRRGVLQYAPTDRLIPIYLYPDNCQVQK